MLGEGRSVGNMVMDTTEHALGGTVWRGSVCVLLLV